MKKIFRGFLVALVVFLLFNSCSTNTDVEYLSEFPIAVEGTGSETIKVSKVVIDVPYGLEVGTIKRNGREKKLKWQDNTVDDNYLSYIVHKKLEDAGYSTYKDVDHVFVDNDETPRYQLAAVINDIDIKDDHVFALILILFINTQKTSVMLDVDWVLYDSVLETIVSTENVVTSINDINRSVPETFVRCFEKNCLTYLSQPQLRDKTVGMSDNVASPRKKSLKIDYSTKPLPQLKQNNISQYFDRMVMLRYGTSFGSGVLISNDGYILTAAHVVSGSDEVNVRFYDGSSKIGKVVRRDVVLDAAIVKVEGVYKAMPLSVDVPPVGSNVYVVGTPMSKKLDFSLTTGVVSGVRHLYNNDYFQTDAAINPGNSGGPMIDESGRVIGITVLSRPQAENISLALQVKWIVEKLNLSN